MSACTVLEADASGGYTAASGHHHTAAAILAGSRGKGGAHLLEYLGLDYIVDIGEELLPDEAELLDEAELPEPESKPAPERERKYHFRACTPYLGALIAWPGSRLRTVRACLWGSLSDHDHDGVGVGRSVGRSIVGLNGRHLHPHPQERRARLRGACLMVAGSWRS